jgi:hypothetical protein
MSLKQQKMINGVKNQNLEKKARLQELNFVH